MHGSSDAVKNKVSTFGVTGMSCASCAGIVEDALRSLPGVRSASVNLATEKAHIVYDPTVTSPASIRSSVIDAGYDIAVSDITLAIGGMSCATCARTIEIALFSMDGVFSANKKLATDSVKVVFDPDSVTLGSIKKKITDAGYEVIAGTGQDEGGARERERWHQRNLLIFALSLSVPIFLLMLAFDLFGLGATLGITGSEGLVLFVLATPVQFIAGHQFYVGTYKAIRNGRANMDMLIAIGSSAAYFYGAAVVFFPELITTHDTYFDTSSLIISLILLGKYLESKAKRTTSLAVRGLLELQPRTARAIKDGKEVEVPIEDLDVGDIIIVRPGEKVPTDGTVMDGYSAIDESMITGESIPNEKHTGSSVIGGSINKNGVLKIRATKVGKDTALSQIIKLVEDAQASKAPIQRYADRVSSWFVPAVMTIASISFLVWYLYAYSAWDRGPILHLLIDGLHRGTRDIVPLRARSSDPHRDNGRYWQRGRERDLDKERRGPRGCRKDRHDGPR